MIPHGPRGMRAAWQQPPVTDNPEAHTYLAQDHSAHGGRSRDAHANTRQRDSSWRASHQATGPGVSSQDGPAASRVTTTI